MFRKLPHSISIIEKVELTVKLHDAVTLLLIVTVLPNVAGSVVLTLEYVDTVNCVGPMEPKLIVPVAKLFTDVTPLRSTLESSTFDAASVPPTDRLHAAVALLSIVTLLENVDGPTTMSAPVPVMVRVPDSVVFVTVSLI